MKEGSQLYEGIVQLKMLSSDGKYYKTDVATTQQLFRLIQSIPSPKAEPFKIWMAQVAAERLNQMQDPELSIEQAMKDAKTYSVHKFVDHKLVNYVVCICFFIGK